MKAVLLLGLLAVALCEPIRYEGDKVFRLKPMTSAHVSFIKDLANTMKVDFWAPDSADLVSVNTVVDVRVPASHIDMMSVMLQQSGMDHKVLIEDLQDAINAQTDNTIQTRAHDYFKYNNWATIEEWVDTITAANPAVLSRSVIGNTYEGRTMHLLKVGIDNGSTKPAIFMDCGFHAREWISHAFCQWFVKEAVTTYGSNTQMTNLLDNMDVYVLPVMNIDGYEYSWTNDRMWRKTRSRNSGTSCIGTDPNRNFDAGWCILGSSSSPCSDVYCGPTMESEIEVKNMANFIRNNKDSIKAYITIHSYSQLILFPYSYKFDLAPDHEELLRVGDGAAAALTSLYGTSYTVGPGAITIYPSSGGSDDWSYDLGVKYSYTFELRDEGWYGFLLPESEIQPTCEETMLAVLHIADEVMKSL